MQFAADGYAITGEPLTLVGPQATIRVGDGTADGARFTATIAAELTGDTQLGEDRPRHARACPDQQLYRRHGHRGRHAAISADANLGDAAGGLTFNGGRLRTTADLESDRAVSLTERARS